MLLKAGLHFNANTWSWVMLTPKITLRCVEGLVRALAQMSTTPGRAQTLNQVVDNVVGWKATIPFQKGRRLALDAKAPLETTVHKCGRSTTVKQLHQTETLVSCRKIKCAQMDGIYKERPSRSPRSNWAPRSISSWATTFIKWHFCQDTSMCWVEVNAPEGWHLQRAS